MKLILASQSVARKKVLEDLGFELETVISDYDESCPIIEPGSYVKMIAENKMKQLSIPRTENILTCDTIIYFEGERIGKMQTRDDAFRLLRRLSGKKHSVYTGYCYYDRGRNEYRSGYEEAHVWFRDLSDDDIERNLDTGDWKGAAGAYRIQESGKDLISHTEGHIWVIIGLPKELISDLMNTSVR